MQGCCLFDHWLGVLSLIGYLKKDGIYKNYSIDVKKLRILYWC